MDEKVIEALEKEPSVGRAVLSGSLHNFIKVMFWYINRREFQFEWFHDKIIKALEDRVFGRAEKKNLVINIAPRFGKSEICKMFCAWSYMVNPSGNCIYTSYSDDLATGFSKDIKDIVTSPLFKKLTGISIKKDKSGADYWALANGGGFRAASMGGSLTGYGAGWSEHGYGGVLLIDDPVKASSVTSQAELQRYIDYYNNTLRSRLNNPKETPIVMIMQRLSIDDLTGYVMEVEKDDWEQIKLPALNEETGVALWESKFPKEDLLKIKKYNKFVYYGQYEQEPIVLGGSVIKSEWFRFYDKLPEFQFMFVTSDTAQKKGEANDFTVICLWGVSWDSKLYLVDMVRGKFDADELREQVKICWNKWLKMRPMPYGFYMEDKASGIGVIQEMSKEGAIPIIPVTRNRYKKDDGTWASMDKFSRVMQAVPYIMNGWVYLPNNENDVISEQVLSECVAFKADLSHKHDDICLAGDTKIATLFGDKKIKDVKTGDRVITPDGLGKVIKSEQTGIKKTIKKFGLEATPNHKIFATDKYERIDRVNDISKTDKLSLKGLIKWRYKRLLYSMESPTGLWGREGTIYLSRHITLDGGVLKDCMLRCGGFIRGKAFRKGMLFITKTTILSIMTFLIWSVYRGSNTLKSIRQTVISGLRVMPAKSTLMKSEGLQKNGTIAQKADNGIVKTHEDTLTALERQKCVRYVEENIRHAGKQKSVLNTETQNTTEKSGQNVKPVYNLTIERDGVYYANGILVSNCDNICDAVSIAFGADGVGSIYI